MSNSNLNQEQQAPVPGNGPDCWELVLADMAERRLIGIAKYGTPLRPDNGRNALVDAYQEVLDLAVYLRAAIEQQAEKRAIAAEARMKELEARNARMLAALLDWERWEADWIMSDEAWNTKDGLPKLTQELYDRMIELQQQRNNAKHA